MKQIKVYIPLIVGACLAVGTIIGAKLNFQDGGEQIFAKNSKKDKLNRLIDYIDYEYVDEVNTEINTQSPVVESLAFNSSGQLIATLTDGSSMAVDISEIPRVGNSSALEGVSDSIGEGNEGLAMAAKHNRMGVPANDDWGVLFFVQGR